MIILINKEQFQDNEIKMISKLTILLDKQYKTNIFKLNKQIHHKQTILKSFHNKEANQE